MIVDMNSLRSTYEIRLAMNVLAGDDFQLVVYS